MGTNVHTISRNILMITTDHLMIDRRILQEAKSLVEKGHRVTLLAGFECPEATTYEKDGVRIERFIYDWEDMRFTALAKRLKLNANPIIHRISARLFRLWANRIARLNSFNHFVLRNMLKHPVDVIHVHDYPMLAVGVAFARLKKIPLVYDAHELYYAQVQLSKKTQKKYRRLESKLIPHASEVITVNPYIAQLMAQRFKMATPPHTLLNASPLKPIQPSNQLRTQFDIAPSTHIVLYQGWISDNRGIHHIVEAASHFNENIALVIIGYGDYEKKLKALAYELQLEKRVFFYGGVASDELHTLTCEASIGIIPYHGVDENNHYCSPNKLFEFTVAGLPFISNDLPFLHDIATQYGHGVLANLKSAQSIATTVNQVLGAPDTLNQLKASALKAREQLNWEVEAEKLFNIYEHLLPEPQTTST